MMSQLIGDLISREETLTAFSDYVASGMSMDDFGALWDIVAKIPPVNPQEPKTGHWERISNDITLIQHDTAYYKCSECGEKVIGKHNHCQFCGAKMVEPQESENKE